MTPIKILIADDHRLIREAWSFILNRDARFQVVAECNTSELAIIQAKETRPDIILLNISIFNAATIELTMHIRKFCPGWKILLISPYSFPDIARRMIKAGASGYITKTSPIKELIDALIAIKQGYKYRCDEIKNIDHLHLKKSLEPEVRLRLLTAREIEIISAIKQGLTSKEIAGLLNISTKTVERHRYTISKKLNLNNTPQLVDFVNKYQLEL